jgi:hypothetical protein
VLVLKLIIFLLFVAVVVSLFSGLNFLVKDLGNRRKRLLYALGVRVSLVAILLATVAYGVASGQLRSTAPWDQQLRPEASAPTGQR